MHILEVPASHLAKFADAMNDANIVYRTTYKNRHSYNATINIKNQSDLEKAQEIFKNLK